MKIYLIFFLLLLAACSSAPNRCNQKSAKNSFQDLASVEYFQFHS